MDRPYRTNQRVQIVFKSGRRFSWPTTVEQIRKNAQGQLVGYVYHNAKRWRVRQLECGEWMGVDADNQRQDISDRDLDEMEVADDE